MKKLLIIISMITISISQVYAYNLYVEDTENQNNNQNVDKFVPTSGVKIKPSPLAQMMENATKNATQKTNNNQNKQNQQELKNKRRK